MIDIIEIYDAEQRARRILGRMGYRGKKVFSDKETEGIVDAASFDALEGLAHEVPAFNIRGLGWVARCYGADSEAVKRIFRDYRNKDSETDIFPLLFRAQYAIDFEKYPFPLSFIDDPIGMAA